VVLGRGVGDGEDRAGRLRIRDLGFEAERSYSAISIDPARST
jgi:hypothetical protein